MTPFSCVQLQKKTVLLFSCIVILILLVIMNVVQFQKADIQIEKQPASISSQHESRKEFALKMIDHYLSAPYEMYKEIFSFITIQMVPVTYLCDMKQFRR